MNQNIETLRNRDDGPAEVNQARRDEIAEMYFDSLEYEPYPVQEESIFGWFANRQGILVCAPTGTGKTLIAEAALFEALHLGRTAYYTTPLIALTDQKFRELQEKVVRWGFRPDDVGLVTGNRKINPDAKVQVVVAEILLNRLLHHEAFSFDDVWAVVMDEFHSFNDPERGIVWEFGLSLLPQHVRTLLISATVGNAVEFTQWLRSRHQRDLSLIQETERKVPLTYQWVDDCLLSEHLERMMEGPEPQRLTPALVFCFNREQCWTIAEQLKGKRLVTPEQQKELVAAIEQYDWSQGAGPKLKQILIRGIGVHHAGVMPRYRRIVEQLYQAKLLSVCVCTETLAAGINLPARSVVLPTLLKGPPRKKKLIDPSSAHQMFGRAGRPQYDDRGYVFALAHEDDVKILRYQKKIDQIPEDTKDPGLIKARKQLKKKMPKRRSDVQYWSEQQFQQLIQAPPGDLQSRGSLPWRLLVYMLNLSPEVERIRKLVAGRLLDPKGHERAQRELDRMLLTLWRGGFVSLEPKPPASALGGDRAQGHGRSEADADRQGAAGGDESTDAGEQEPQSSRPVLDLGQRSLAQQPSGQGARGEAAMKNDRSADAAGAAAYRAELAVPQKSMSRLLGFRGVHPLYAVFLLNHLGIADRNERIQAIESLLELPRSIGPAIRIPSQEELPPGPLATTRLDPQLLKLGLATSEELGAKDEDEDDDRRRGWFEERPEPMLTLPHKLHRLFQYDFPGVDDVRIRPVWAAGAVLDYGGDFNKYVTSNKLQKQEGMIFRHLLRMVLLIDELAMIAPPDVQLEQWRQDLGELADELESICLEVDSESTQKWLDESRGDYGWE